MWGVSWAPIWGCKIADLRTGPGRRDTAFMSEGVTLSVWIWVFPFFGARTTRRSCGQRPCATHSCTWRHAPPAWGAPRSPYARCCSASPRWPSKFLTQRHLSSIPRHRSSGHGHHSAPSLDMSSNTSPPKPASQHWSGKGPGEEFVTITRALPPGVGALRPAAWGGRRCRRSGWLFT